jgi:hypothetical protein
MSLFILCFCGIIEKMKAPVAVVASGLFNHKGDDDADGFLPCL